MSSEVQHFRRVAFTPYYGTEQGSSPSVPAPATPSRTGRDMSPQKSGFPDFSLSAELHWYRVSNNKLFESLRICLLLFCFQRLRTSIFNSTRPKSFRIMDCSMQGSSPLYAMLRKSKSLRSFASKPL